MSKRKKSERILYLHAGAVKTGTTAIQNVLENCREQLKSQHLIYPLSYGATSSQSGLISRNGTTLFNDEETTIEVLQSAVKPTGRRDSILFSNENMLYRAVKNNCFASAAHFAQKFGFDSVKVLFILRDPIVHAASVWNQNVANGIQTKSIDDWIQSADYIRIFSRGLCLMRSLSNVQLEVRNYSHIRDDLFSTFFSWLGIEPCEPSSHYTFPGNRSLTRSELLLQQQLNNIDPSYAIVARELCETLPDVRPERVGPSVEAQKIFLEKNEEYLDLLNSFLPEGESLDLSLQQFITLDDDAGAQLDQQQLRSVANSLRSREVNVQRSSQIWLRKSVNEKTEHVAQLEKQIGLLEAEVVKLRAAENKLKTDVDNIRANADKVRIDADKIRTDADKFRTESSNTIQTLTSDLNVARKELKTIKEDSVYFSGMVGRSTIFRKPLSFVGLYVVYIGFIAVSKIAIPVFGLKSKLQRIAQKVKERILCAVEI